MTHNHDSGFSAGNDFDEEFSRNEVGLEIRQINTELGLRFSEIGEDIEDMEKKAERDIQAVKRDMEKQIRKMKRNKPLYTSYLQKVKNPFLFFWGGGERVLRFILKARS